MLQKNNFCTKVSFLASGVGRDERNGEGVRRIGRGRGKGREIQTRENLHEFVLCVADISFVVVVVVAVESFYFSLFHLV